MADNKNYYYMRLKEDFFGSDEMILLEDMQDGYLYSNILLKLYLKSLKGNGRLMFNDLIPYNAKMLASITHHNVGVVEKALDTFQQLGLIEILDNGAIYMMNIQNFIGKSSTEADRKREYERRISNEKRNIGEISEKSTPEIDIEKEIEKEIYTVSKDTVRQTEVRRCLEEWNSLSEYGIKQVSRISAGSQRYDWLVARIKQYGIDDVLEAIDKIKCSSFLQGKTNSRRAWKITFDWFVRPNNFPKVLDGNYDDDEKNERMSEYADSGGRQ